MDGLNEDAQFLGDMDHVSLEAIAALSPDLLILFSTEPAQKALGEAAEGIGIHVYYTNIDSFDDYDRVMKELTGFTGCSGAYERHVEQVREEIGGILRQVPEKAEKDSYLLLHVSATKSKAEKNDYFACEILNRLGLDNLAGDSSAFDVLSMEAIVAADPDYIFVVPREMKKAAESYEKLFSSQPAWEALSAVRDGRHFLLDKNLFGLKPNARWAEAYRRPMTFCTGSRENVCDSRNRADPCCGCRAAVRQQRDRSGRRAADAGRKRNEGTAGDRFSGQASANSRRFAFGRRTFGFRLSSAEQPE